jgi:hypothetical protein
MYDVQPRELIDALNEVLKLRADWYQLPKGDTIDEQKPDPDRKRRKPKNA